MEAIAFDNAEIYEVTKEEIDAMRIDLPNIVLDKCIKILNETFSLQMHSINYMSELNPSCSFDFVKFENDLQYLQTVDRTYVLAFFVRVEK